MTGKETTTTRNAATAQGWRGWFLKLKIDRRQADLRRRCRRHADALAQIPPHVRQFWLDEATDELPGWQPTEADWVIAAGALMEFFDCCRMKTTALACALPSKAADSVWHLWLKHDPAGLAEFQQRVFRMQVPHQEADELGTDLESALAQSWTLACRSEGLSPLGRRLPLMFAADWLLRVPTGWAYSCGYQGQVRHQDIDGLGCLTGRYKPHVGLAAASLAGLGLLTMDEAAMAERRKQAMENGGGGSSCGSSGDGGCSCGSSCGSGCGGGGCGS